MEDLKELKFLQYLKKSGEVDLKHKKFYISLSPSPTSPKKEIDEVV